MYSYRFRRNLLDINYVRIKLYSIFQNLLYCSKTRVMPFRQMFFNFTANVET